MLLRGLVSENPWLQELGCLSRKAATITSTHDGLQIYLKRPTIQSGYLIREMEPPRWASYSEATIRGAVASYGLSISFGDRLVELCRGHRSFHQLRDTVLLTYRLGALFALERYGVDFQFLVTKRPSVLLMESSEVAARVRALCDLVGEPSKVRQILCRNQSVLANPPERLYIRLSLLRTALECTFEEVLSAFIHDPTILGFRPETIRRKQQFLYLSMRKHPQALRQLLAYGIDVRVRLVKASPHVLARVPYLLITDQDAIPSFKNVISMSQAAFAEKYPGFYSWYQQLVVELLPEIPPDERQAFGGVKQGRKDNMEGCDQQSPEEPPAVNDNSSVSISVDPVAPKDMDRRGSGSVLGRASCILKSDRTEP